MTEPTESDATTVNSVDRQMAMQTVLMLLLPVLSKNKSIDGEQFLKTIEDIAKEVSESIERPALAQAINTIVRPLRSSVERQKEVAKLQERESDEPSQ